MFPRIVASTFFGCTLGFAAIASTQAKPFSHPFGELREYHKHWLAVCPDKSNRNAKDDYTRSCWASTYSGNEDGSIGAPFPGYRLSLLKDRFTGSFKITFVANLNSSYVKNGEASIRFSDGKIMPLEFGRDIITNGNTINEFTFVDPDLTYDLITRMRYANYIRIILPAKSGKQSIQFSTQGLRAAMNFISIQGRHHNR